MNFEIVFGDADEVHDSSCFCAANKIKDLKYRGTNKRATCTKISEIRTKDVMERTNLNTDILSDMFTFQFHRSFIYSIYATHDPYGIEKGTFLYGAINDKPVTIFRKEPRVNAAGSVQCYYAQGNIIRVPGLINPCQLEQYKKYIQTDTYLKQLKRFSDYIGIDYFTRHKLSIR